MDIIYIEQISDKFNQITKKPEKFLSAPEKLKDNIKECLKETYDFIKNNETTKTSNTLPTLIVENFDVEQIWQQIELQNDEILAKHLKTVGRLVAQKDNLWLVDDDSNKNVNDENLSNGDNSSDDENPSNENLNNGKNSSDDENISGDDVNESKNDESFDDDDDETNTNKEKKKSSDKTQSKKSSVDDDFFKLDEMEKFLNREEQNPKLKSNDDDEEEDDEESVDLFDMKSDDDIEEDEENSDVEANPKYDEFFGETNETENKRKRAEESSDDDNENEDESENEDINLKSSLEMKNERLQKRIENIEEQALEDKAWQYKGEVTADKRPQNSLLEEIVDFDMTVRPAPVITEETTYKLEDVIKKRIKDKVWDDVERKTKLVESFNEYKKKLVLDQEKSKQSLAQIYEDDYLKQKEALNPDASDKPEEEPKEQTEIKSLMRNLFSKLDALSNFHFTPKSVAPELRIVNNLPAINMEEVTPVASSDAALLAPEEIKRKTKGNVIGKAERTKTDKNRERRQKKSKQREHAKDVQNKEKSKQKAGLGVKFDKQKAGHLLDKITKDSNVNKMKESGTGAKSSTAFFTQLQDEVRGHIKKKTSQMKKNNNKPIHIAKKLKM